MSVLLAFIADLKKRNIYAAISPHLWETLPAPTRWVFIYLFIFQFYESVVCLIFRARNDLILHSTSVETKDALLSLFAVLSSSSTLAWFVSPHTPMGDSPPSMPSHIFLHLKAISSARATSSRRSSAVTRPAAEALRRSHWGGRPSRQHQAANLLRLSKIKACKT